MSDIKAINLGLEYIKCAVDEIRADQKKTNELTIKNQEKIKILEKIVYGTLLLAIGLIIKGFIV